MIVKYPVTVHVFLFRGEDVLLLRRFNTGYEDGKYSVPAGHVESDETILQAAVREAQEELGIVLVHDELRFAGVMHRRSDDVRVDFFVQTARWQGEPTNMEPDKCDELLWAPIRSLPSNVIPYVRRALENDHSEAWYEEFGWADRAISAW